MNQITYNINYSFTTLDATLVLCALLLVVVIIQHLQLWRLRVAGLQNAKNIKELQYQHIHNEVALKEAASIHAVLVADVRTRVNPFRDHLALYAGHPSGYGPIEEALQDVGREPSACDDDLPSFLKVKP